MKQKLESIYLDRLIIGMLLIVVICMSVVINNVANRHELQMKQMQDVSVDELKDKQTIINEQAEHIEKLKQSARESGTKLIGTDFEVTYYNACCVTKSGRTVYDGVTVAVDPAVIPLGSWIRITMPDGRTLIRRADDTGGAVQGRVIDVYADETDKVLMGYGRERNVKVEVMSGE